MPNMSAIIIGSNKNKVNSEDPEIQLDAKKRGTKCTCERFGYKCPLDGNCRIECVIYKATVTTVLTREAKEYIGCTEGSFIKRWHGHQKSFKHIAYRNDTALSTFLWKLKEKGIEYEISWEILDKVPLVKRSSRFCNLCVTEKWRILHMDEKTRINKLSEYVNKCRHVTKFKISNIKYTKEIDILDHTEKPGSQPKVCIPRIDNEIGDWMNLNPRVVLVDIGRELQRQSNSILPAEQYLVNDINTRKKKSGAKSVSFQHNRNTRSNKKYLENFVEK